MKKPNCYIVETEKCYLLDHFGIANGICKIEKLATKDKNGKVYTAGCRFTKLREDKKILVYITSCRIQLLSYLCLLKSK